MKLKWTMKHWTWRFFLRSGIRNQTGFQRHSLFFWRFEVFIASSWWCFPFPIHIMRIRKYHDVKIINDSILELFSFNLLGGLPYNWSVAQKKGIQNLIAAPITLKILCYYVLPPNGYSTKPVPSHYQTTKLHHWWIPLFTLFASRSFGSSLPFHIKHFPIKYGFCNGYMGLSENSVPLNPLDDHHFPDFQ